MPKPTTIDEYLATRPPHQRAALAQLRRVINAAAPMAEECINYQLPAFRYHRLVENEARRASSRGRGT